MRLTPILLGGSLLVNAAVVAIFVAGVSRPKVAAEAPAESVPAPAPAMPRSADLWAEVRSDDLHQQTEKLRAEGFPPATIRAIVAAQIRAKFAARRKALDTSQADTPFWKTRAPDPATQASLRALAKEEQKAIKDVLGPDPEHGATAELKRQFPGFADEVLEQMAAIRERYNEQRNDIYSSVRGTGSLLPEDQAKVQALEKAMLGEFAAILKPQEFEEYQLRTSNTANQLRYNLVAFDPSEQEFRTLYKLQSAFDEQFSMRSGPSTEEQRRTRTEAQNQLNEQIKAALGPERFTEYQRATDYNYRQTTQLVARLDLPPETAVNLYAVQKEFEQRRSELYRTSPGPNVAAAQAALYQEAMAKVSPILGDPKNVEAYKQYGGSWIASLAPRPPPPASPAPR